MTIAIGDENRETPPSNTHEKQKEEQTSPACAPRVNMYKGTRSLGPGGRRGAGPDTRRCRPYSSPDETPFFSRRAVEWRPRVSVSTIHGERESRRRRRTFQSPLQYTAPRVRRASYWGPGCKRCDAAHARGDSWPWLRGRRKSFPPSSGSVSRIYQCQQEKSRGCGRELPSVEPSRRV